MCVCVCMCVFEWKSESVNESERVRMCVFVCAFTVCVCSTYENHRHVHLFYSYMTATTQASCRQSVTAQQQRVQRLNKMAVNWKSTCWSRAMLGYIHTEWMLYSVRCAWQTWHWNTTRVNYCGCLMLTGNVVSRTAAWKRCRVHVFMCLYMK